MAARKRRGRTPRSGGIAQAGQASRTTAGGRQTSRDEPPGLPDWKWRTFPVFAALLTGMLVAFVVNGGSMNPVAYVLQIVALLGVGYCIAHFVVRNVITSGRLRRRDAIARGETPAEDLEDVVVYPKDKGSSPG